MKLLGLWTADNVFALAFLVWSVTFVVLYALVMLYNSQFGPYSYVKRLKGQSPTYTSKEGRYVEVTDPELHETFSRFLREGVSVDRFYAKRQRLRTLIVAVWVVLAGMTVLSGVGLIGVYVATYQDGLSSTWRLRMAFVALMAVCILALLVFVKKLITPSLLDVIPWFKGHL